MYDLNIIVDAKVRNLMPNANSRMIKKQKTSNLNANQEKLDPKTV